jgi:hypothetical protein
MRSEMTPFESLPPVAAIGAASLAAAGNPAVTAYAVIGLISLVVGPVLAWCQSRRAGCV